MNDSYNCCPCPQATSNGSEEAHGHPKDPEFMQLWDNNYMKERGLSLFRGFGDDDLQVRIPTNAACTDAKQLNKFQPDSMALKVAMDMKSKTVAQQVTTVTSSSKALPINYGLFADFVIEDRSLMARYIPFCCQNSY